MQTGDWKPRKAEAGSPGTRALDQKVYLCAICGGGLLTLPGAWQSSRTSKGAGGRLRCPSLAASLVSALLGSFSLFGRRLGTRCDLVA